jgi:hypothetical protein
MANLQQSEVVGLLQQLFDHYGRKLTPIGQSVYCKYLGNLTVQELITVIEWAITTQKFLPTPVEMLGSIAPSIDELWAKLLKFSNELSGYRYDQHKLNTRKKEMLELLPEAVRDFLTVHNVSLLNLGYESDTQQKALKKALSTHLDKTLSSVANPSLNGKQQVLLN